MKGKLLFICLIILTVLLFFAGLYTGSSHIDSSTIWKAIVSYNANDSYHFIIVNLRLPRLFLAFLVGASLSLSGYVMQAMVNNPLADPYILGTASGASLGASIVYLVLPVSMINIFIPSVSAFAGAMLITFIAVLIAYQKGHLMPTKLLLAGVGLSSLTVAIMSFFIFFSDDESKLKTIIFWSMGSFEGARWSYIPLLAVVLLIAIVLYSYLNKNLNLLLLGESRSYNLGLNVKALRWFILISSSVITGFAVATSGPIGFVGLMVPHVIRGIFGVTGKLNILFTALVGGTFLLGCDIFSRIIYPPTGIPIGIITSFLGIPFFVYLLSRNNYRFN